MADFNWGDHPTANQDFDWGAHPAADESAKPNVSQLESAGRGFAQGSTFGFSDEGGAGIYSALEKYLPEDIKTSISGRNPNLEYQAPQESLGDIYKTYRDTDRAANSAAQEANPNTYLAGEIGGAALTQFVPGMQGAGAIGQGGLAGMGYSNAEDLSGVLKDTAIGAGIGLGGDLAVKGLSKAAPYIGRGFQKIGDKLKGAADDFYIKATGATGREAERFAPGAADELRNYVSFGDSPENIASKLEQQVEKSGKKIGSALDEAGERGARVDLVKYLEDSERKVSELRSMGNFKEAQALESQTSEIIDQANKMGITDVSPSFMENIKRESQAGINYFTDAKPAVAGKKVGASMQRQAVEDSVEGLGGGLSQEFKENKRLFGLLDPIQEAAAKRASQLNQSPFGGLGDAASMAATGSPLGAVGRRILAPRAASAAAVSLDNIAEIVKTMPQLFGRFSGPLTSASARGPQAVAATHFMLQQTEPEYRAIINKVADTDQQENKDAFTP